MKTYYTEYLGRKGDTLTSLPTNDYEFAKSRFLELKRQGVAIRFVSRNWKGEIKNEG